MDPQKKTRIYSQHDLRRLMSERKLKSDCLKSMPEKINSPLAKYNSLGNLTCVICRTLIKSSSLWKVHINSNQHKQKCDAAKTFKNKLLSNKMTKSPTNQTKDDTNSCSTYIETTKTTLFEMEQKSSEPLNIIKEHEILPEKFFDDPVMDAKVRNAEYKDPDDEEWDRFQREIKEESTMSNAIIAGEQDNAAAERQLDEIDEQMERWTKVIYLEEKKNLILQRPKHRCIQRNAGCFDESSGDECDSFDEFSNWRSKRFANK